LAGSQVQPSTTVGFPHGAHTTRSKLVEAEQALSDGGTELDMVVNVGKVLSLDYGYVRAEIARRAAAHAERRPEAESHLRELLPGARAQARAV
jgi:deoxyribose-phosphate aldolase